MKKETCKRLVLWAEVLLVHTFLSKFPQRNDWLYQLSKKSVNIKPGISSTLPLRVLIFATSILAVLNIIKKSLHRTIATLWISATSSRFLLNRNINSLLTITANSDREYKAERDPQLESLYSRIRRKNILTSTSLSKTSYMSHYVPYYGASKRATRASSPSIYLREEDFPILPAMISLVRP